MWVLLYRATDADTAVGVLPAVWDPLHRIDLFCVDGLGTWPLSSKHRRKKDVHGAENDAIDLFAMLTRGMHRVRAVILDLLLLFSTPLLLTTVY